MVTDFLSVLQCKHLSLHSTKARRDECYHNTAVSQIVIFLFNFCLSVTNKVEGCNLGISHLLNFYVDHMRRIVFVLERKYVLYLHINFQESDMEKGADAETLSAEILTDCGNFVFLRLHFSHICYKKSKDCGFVTYLIQYL